MGTFSRHSCSKFTLRISHWLPSASRDRASRAPEDYNSINTFLFAILFPCLSPSPSLSLFFPPMSLSPPSSNMPHCWPGHRRKCWYFRIVETNENKQVRRRLSFCFTRARDTKEKKSPCRFRFLLSFLSSLRVQSLAIFENYQSRRVCTRRKLSTR